MLPGIELRDDTVRLATRNVAALTLDFGPGLCPLDATRAPLVIINGDKLEAPSPRSDRSWRVHFSKFSEKWRIDQEPTDETVLRKRHDLQGPIDDAFMDLPPECAPWELPVRPFDGETWLPGSETAIPNSRRLFRALPALRRCLLKSPQLTRLVLSRDEFGHQAESLSALYRLAKLSSVATRFDVLHAAEREHHRATHKQATLVDQVVLAQCLADDVEWADPIWHKVSDHHWYRAARAK